MSTDLTNDEVRIAASLLSRERLATFTMIAGTDRDAIALHHAMLALNGALSPVIAVIEIALRNAACERLRSTFGVPDWLANPPSPFVWRGEERNSLTRATRQAQRAAYTKKSAAEKKALDALAFPNGAPPDLSHEDRSKARQSLIEPVSGQVIAQLTFHFWKRLLSADYEAALWQRSLKRLFPDKRLSRGVVAVQLEVLYQARNRIAHHEPIYGPRLTKVLDAIEFIATRFGTEQPDANGILNRLLSPHMVKLQRDALSLETMIGQFAMTVR